MTHVCRPTLCGSHEAEARILPDADFPPSWPPPATAGRAVRAGRALLLARIRAHRGLADTHLPDGQPGFGADLAAWLRDVLLGPVSYGQVAQIVLRGTQAALNTMR